MKIKQTIGIDISKLTFDVRIHSNQCYHVFDNTPKGFKELIHHSDRGIQYCSNIYTQILKRKKIAISMTEENHCYENSLAECVNGILKDVFYLDQTFTNTARAKRAAKSVINLYNQIRLHLSLDCKTPNMVYKLTA